MNKKVVFTMILVFLILVLIPNSSSASLNTGDEHDNEEGVVIWPYHAIVMTAGVVILLYAMYVVMRGRKGWFGIHKTLTFIGSLLILIGFIIAFTMVSIAKESHFKITHSYFGLTTLSLVTLTAILGLIHIRFRNRKKETGFVHKLIGFVTLVLLVITILLGLIHVGLL